MKKYQKVNEEKLKERNNNIVKPPKKKKKKKAHQRINQAKKTYSLKINRKKSFKIFQGKKQTNKKNKRKNPKLASWKWNLFNHMGPPIQKGPALGLMLCCHSFEIIPCFWTRDTDFHFALHLANYVTDPACSHTISSLSGRQINLLNYKSIMYSPT